MHPAFEHLIDLGFRPFAFGASANLRRLVVAPLGVPLTLLPAEGDAALPMHRALWRMNQHAYGGLGMPAWVQLDCGVLPSAFVGWMRRADALPAELRAVLDADASDDQFLPVAESLAIPTAEPGTWMSYSLCAALPGFGLGLLSKSLALAAYGCERALGVAQYDNSAVRIHCRFGPLHLREARVPFHDKAARTFVYSLDLRDPSVIERALRPHGEAPTPDLWLDPSDAAACAALNARVRNGEAVCILPPGPTGQGTGVRVPLGLGRT